MRGGRRYNNVGDSYAKPEYALKRAEELLRLKGKDEEEEALTTLYSVVTSKRHKTWTKESDKIMKKFLELCVKRQKGKKAKDGLHQFRNITQQQQDSLKDILEFFINKAQEAVEKAQREVSLVHEEERSKDSAQSKEATLLSSISGEGSQARLERELVTPWLKFLWETYRTVLEILRNNPKLEHVYRATTTKAFDFCLRYKRVSEFRRLSEILRTHLSNTTKGKTQPTYNAENPEDLRFLLKIRFAQLATATGLELWQEAYRSVEDINGIMNMTKESPPDEMMVEYYKRLAMIFWVSKNYVFHANALHKYFELSSSIDKNLSSEDKQLLASKVWLASLSIPLEDESKDETYFLGFDIEKERQMKIAGLFGFDVDTRRAVLINKLETKNIKSMVHPQIADLYDILEIKFHPLNLPKLLKHKFDFLNSVPGLKQYADPIADLAVIKVLQQLSKVYQTMEITKFHNLMCFIDNKELEKHVVKSIRDKHIDCRIDYLNGVLSFNSLTLESENINSKLVEVAQNLQQIVEMIDSDKQRPKLAKMNKELAHLNKAVDEEHVKVLKRKPVIEQLKEIRERQEAEDARKLEEAEKQKQQEQLEKERKKAQQKMTEREQTRLAKVQKEREEELRLLAITQYVKDTTVSEELKRKLNQGIDPSTFVEEQIKRMNTKRTKLEQRLEELEMKLNHMVRARREAEIPMIVAERDRNKSESLKFWEEETKKYLENSKIAHAKEIEEKARLSRMRDDKNALTQMITERRQQEYLKKNADRENQINQLKMQKMREMQEKMKKEEEEREKRKKEEESKKKIEEKKRKEEEKKRKEEEKKKKEEEARNKKIEEEKRKELHSKDLFLSDQTSWAQESEQKDQLPASTAPLKTDEKWRKGGAQVPKQPPKLPEKQEDRRTPLGRERTNENTSGERPGISRPPFTRTTEKTSEERSGSFRASPASATPASRADSLTNWRKQAPSPSPSQVEEKPAPAPARQEPKGSPSLYQPPVRGRGEPQTSTWRNNKETPPTSVSRGRGAPPKSTSANPLPSRGPPSTSQTTRAPERLPSSPPVTNQPGTTRPSESLDSRPWRSTSQTGIGRGSVRPESKIEPTEPKAPRPDTKAERPDLRKGAPLPSSAKKEETNWRKDNFPSSSAKKDDGGNVKGKPLNPDQSKPEPTEPAEDGWTTAGSKKNKRR